MVVGTEAPSAESHDAGLQERMGDKGNKKANMLTRRGSSDIVDDSLKTGVSSRRGSELMGGSSDGKPSKSAAGGKEGDVSHMTEEKLAKRRNLNMNVKSRNGPPPTGDEYRQWKVQSIRSDLPQESARVRKRVTQRVAMLTLWGSQVQQAKGADKRLVALEQRVERLAELENLLQELDAAEQAAMERGWATAQSAPTLPLGRQVDLPGTVMTGEHMDMMSTAGSPPAQTSMNLMFASRDATPVGGAATLGTMPSSHEGYGFQGLAQEDEGEHPKPLPSLIWRKSSKPADGGGHHHHLSQHAEHLMGAIGGASAVALSSGDVRRAVKEEIDQIFMSMGQRPFASSAAYPSAHDYNSVYQTGMPRGENSILQPDVMHADTGMSYHGSMVDGTMHGSTPPFPRGDVNMWRMEPPSEPPQSVHSKAANARTPGPPDNFIMLNEADFKSGLSVSIPPEDSGQVPPIDGSKAVQEGDKPIVQAGARTLLEAVPFSCSFLFGGLSRENSFRRLCFWIYRNPVCSAFFQLTNLANASLLTMYPEWFGTNVMTLDNHTMEVDASKDLLRIVKFFDLACVGVLFLEVLVGITALGFFKQSSCWLR